MAIDFGTPLMHTLTIWSGRIRRHRAGFLKSTPPLDKKFVEAKLAEDLAATAA
jgi:hypothetical protein